ncbi:hypothetical protein M3Y96_01148000 [Aphelenchoides besseyi]|nr:hypothetical protein M3Y96_01148000 [Aphelenchoides besseyi]
MKVVCITLFDGVHLLHLHSRKTVHLLRYKETEMLSNAELITKDVRFQEYIDQAIERYFEEFKCPLHSQRVTEPGVTSNTETAQEVHSSITDFQPATEEVYQKRKRIVNYGLHGFSQLTSWVFQLVYKGLVILGDFSALYPNQTTWIGIGFLIYVSFRLIENSLFDGIEMAIQILWPLIYVFLRTVEHLLRTAAHTCAHLDSMYRGLYCDFIRVWCAEYELMCENRCSFSSTLNGE